ncbi:hypothetical protein SAMN05443429_101329 [Cruoricaptor ignavus]|uniref:Uncharacterized protein n=1 Tax=Cruoricaptor ignavus TaxID=1118202 RepID=A0A1M6AL42_9FLAO|nr:hypothetical protein SAMN05443429_101329 [Cruoricaptor ignavus]
MGEIIFSVLALNNPAKLNATDKNSFFIPIFLIRASKLKLKLKLCKSNKTKLIFHIKFVIIPNKKSRHFQSWNLLKLMRKF